MFSINYISKASKSQFSLLSLNDPPYRRNRKEWLTADSMLWRLADSRPMPPDARQLHPLRKLPGRQTRLPHRPHWSSHHTISPRPTIFSHRLSLSLHTNCPSICVQASAGGPRSRWCRKLTPSAPKTSRPAPRPAPSPPAHRTSTAPIHPRVAEPAPPRRHRAPGGRAGRPAPRRALPGETRRAADAPARPQLRVWSPAGLRAAVAAAAAEGTPYRSPPPPPRSRLARPRRPAPTRHP